VHPDCVAAVEDAARLCEQLGHHVEETSLSMINGKMMSDAFMTIWAAGNAAMLESLSYAVGRKYTPEEIEPATQVLVEMGSRRSAPDYLIAVQMLQVYSRRVAALFEGFDVLLTPTLGEPPLPLGSFDSPPDNPLYGMQRAVAFVPFTPLFNATGQPAMSVPLYWNADGLPIGTHFVGRFGDEATLIRLASQLESARPWRDRRPVVSA
jgi:amidase